MCNSEKIVLAESNEYVSSLLTLVPFFDMYCHFTLVLLLGIHNTNVKQSSFKVLQKSTQFPVPLWI